MKGVDATAPTPTTAVPGEAGWVAEGTKAAKSQKGKEKAIEETAEESEDAAEEEDDDAAWLARRRKAALGGDEDEGMEDVSHNHKLV